MIPFFLVFATIGSIGSIGCFVTGMLWERSKRNALLGSVTECTTCAGCPRNPSRNDTHLLHMERHT